MAAWYRISLAVANVVVKSKEVILRYGPRGGMFFYTFVDEYHLSGEQLWRACLRANTLAPRTPHPLSGDSQ